MLEGADAEVRLVQQKPDSMILAHDDHFLGLRQSVSAAGFNINPVKIQSTGDSFTPPTQAIPHHLVQPASILTIYKLNDLSSENIVNTHVNMAGLGNIELDGRLGIKRIRIIIKQLER